MKPDVLCVLCDHIAMATLLYIYRLVVSAGDIVQHEHTRCSKCSTEFGIQTAMQARSKKQLGQLEITISRLGDPSGGLVDTGLAVTAITPYPDLAYRPMLGGWIARPERSRPVA